jgi:adenine-specific DNA-methyltransferase
MKKTKISSKFNPKSDVILYEGDCLALLSEMPEKFVKLVVTSPPYNIGKQYENKINLDEYIEQQNKVIKECVRVLADDGSICWQVGNFVDNGEIKPLDIVLYPIFSELGLKLRNRIVWHFGHGLHASKRFSGRYEVILWFTKGNDYTFNLDPIRVPQKYPQKKHFKGPKKGQLSGNPLGKNPSDIWEIPNVKANHIEKTIHPCQFPVELIERLVLSMTEKGDWVLDPFMGVGTTAIAALMHERRAIGAEIMLEYISISKERIKLAENGELKVRPINRPVYDPNNTVESKPPKTVKLWDEPSQSSLFQGDNNIETKGKLN